MKSQMIAGRGINLQLFANWDEISAQHAEALKDTGVTSDSLKSLTTKLGELGYDVLFNNKKSAEFVPSSRLHETTAQRDQFKAQVEEQNKQLQALKDGAKGNEALQAQLQTLMDTNSGLLKDLEKTKVSSQLMLAATDAINAQDLLVFVNYENVKLNSKGEVVGAEAEIARLRTEKPYLFQDQNDPKKKKGGSDPNNDKGDHKTSGMNAMIRRAAGRI